MLSNFVYILLPLFLAVGLLRKIREYQWGHCKTKSMLNGKVFIVTGANSGIGKETVRELARRKARVVMACRDLDKTKQVIEDIRREISSGELIPMLLDLASLESVKRFATEVLKDFPKINVLINNAGVSVPVSERRKTEDGYEINFGVNHLGHFLLTYLLLPRLKESSPSRIVIVSSMLHERGVIDFDNLNGEKGFVGAKRRMNPAYCNSKLANMLFNVELNKRIENTGVDCYALCPGFVYTNLFRYSNVKWYHYILFSPIALIFMRTPSQGAQTTLHCATAEELEGKSGYFFRNCDFYEPKVKFDPDVATKLWKVSEEMVGFDDDNSENQ
ncbi:retinol dehydrogenase 12-like isoform X1 [Periplaneta americana]